MITNVDNKNYLFIKISLFLSFNFLLSADVTSSITTSLNLEEKEYIQKSQKLSTNEKELENKLKTNSYKDKEEVIKEYIKIKKYKDIKELNNLDYDQLMILLFSNSKNNINQIELFQQEFKNIKNINDKKILLKKIKNYIKLKATYKEKIFLYSFLGNVLKNTLIDEEIFTDLIEIKPNIKNIYNIEIINAYYSIFYKIDSFNFINMLQKDITKTNDILIKTIIMSRVNLINNYYKKELEEINKSLKNIDYKKYFILKNELDNIIKIYN